MGCAPRSALHLRFPIEKKKNIYIYIYFNVFLGP